MTLATDIRDCDRCDLVGGDAEESLKKVLLGVFDAEEVLCDEHLATLEEETREWSSEQVPEMRPVVLVTEGENELTAALWDTASEVWRTNGGQMIDGKPPEEADDLLVARIEQPIFSGSTDNGGVL